MSFPTYYSPIIPYHYALSYQKCRQKTTNP